MPASFFFRCPRSSSTTSLNVSRNSGGRFPEQFYRFLWRSPSKNFKWGLKITFDSKPCRNLGIIEGETLFGGPMKTPPRRSVHAYRTWDVTNSLISAEIDKDKASAGFTLATSHTRGVEHSFHVNIMALASIGSSIKSQTKNARITIQLRPHFPNQLSRA